MRRLLTLLALLALAGAASAWEKESYEVLAERLCNEFGCQCMEEVKEGSTVPDTRFRDEPAQHCYKPMMDFSHQEPGAWSKPVLNECPALDKAVVWLDEASEAGGCDRWYYIGIALHYFMDAKEFWNQVIGVNQTCRREHEDAVNDYLRFGRTWETCSCGVCVSSEDFIDWLAEYRERVKPLTEARHHSSPTVVILSNELDLPAATKLGYYLDNQKVDVIHASKDGFSQYKNSEFIVVLGGHRAPQTGSIVDSVLTDADKNKILKAVFDGVALKKTNVWVNGQTVYFIAGYGSNETASAAWSARDTVLDKARGLATSPDTSECTVNSDCGTSYYGPWVCTNRQKAVRTLYRPVCRLGECVQRADRPSTVSCSAGKICLSFEGCVDKSLLRHYDGIYRPLFTSWLSSERVTAIKGHDVKLVLYARGYRLNDTMQCQYYDSSDGWTDMGDVTANTTIETKLTLSSNSTGRIIFTQRIRCGNETSSGEFVTLYYGEHNFTLLSIPPPMAFTFTLTPANVTLDSCRGRQNVTLRIENLGATNITCNYTVGREVNTVFVPRVGSTVNRTERRWVFDQWNTTYTLLSYYSGSDFTNVSYESVDDDGDPVGTNITQEMIDQYANASKNVTYYNFTAELEVTARYRWDVPHWSKNIFWVDSDECSRYAIPVQVTCTDEYGQLTTLERIIYVDHPMLRQT